MASCFAGSLFHLIPPMKKNVLIPFILLLAACSTGERETFAHITQRRLDSNGRLMISYQFNTGERIVSDSMEMPNRVVPHDSVKVIFSSRDPEDSRLVLP
jgi:hypothetical protein